MWTAFSGKPEAGPCRSCGSSPCWSVWPRWLSAWSSSRHRRAGFRRRGREARSRRAGGRMGYRPIDGRSMGEIGPSSIDKPARVDDSRAGLASTILLDITGNVTLSFIGTTTGKRPPTIRTLVFPRERPQGDNNRIVNGRLFRMQHQVAAGERTPVFPPNRVGQVFNLSLLFLFRLTPPGHRAIIQTGVQPPYFSSRSPP